MASYPTSASSASSHNHNHHINGEVATAACQKIVSVVSRGAGYEGVTRSALEALSDILGLYIENLFTLSHAYAELSNRTKPNPNDITRTLEELGVHVGEFKGYLGSMMAQGAFGADMLRSAPLELTTMESVPEFLPSDDEGDEENEGERKRRREKDALPSYVPGHLPRFPSKHSFKQTPVYVNRPEDPHKIRELNAQQSRLVEGNLKRLMNAENSIAVQAALRGSAGGSGEKQAAASADTLGVLGDVMQFVNYEAVDQRRKFMQAKQGQGGIVGKRRGVEVGGPEVEAGEDGKRRRMEDDDEEEDEEEEEEEEEWEVVGVENRGVVGRA